MSSALFNFSNTTPAAPSGSVNIAWQGDASNPRNVSASVAAPWYLVTWGIGIGAPVATGADLTAHYLVPSAGKPISITICAKTAPVGADLVIDIQQTPSGGSAASIFSAPLHLPAGQSSIASTAFASGVSFAVGDLAHYQLYPGRIEHARSGHHHTTPRAVSLGVWKAKRRPPSISSPNANSRCLQPKLLSFRR